jgi:hypothetical protein
MALPELNAHNSKSFSNPVMSFSVFRQKRVLEGSLSARTFPKFLALSSLRKKKMRSFISMYQSSGEMPFRQRKRALAGKGI